MELHQLKPIHKLKKSKRIGRGGKRGTFSGRGIKGQSSRAGRKFQPAVRELIKRYPKLKGYRQKTKDKRRGLKSSVLNLEILEKEFKTGEKVNVKSLLDKHLVFKVAGKNPKVKILAKGDIKKALIVEGFSVSKQAKEKIEKAGGKVC
ncbi:MAG: uL15 family ribosomal protein [bacterium]|nr:uL15 family ribosomal protein [bacterium]